MRKRTSSPGSAQASTPSARGGAAGSAQAPEPLHVAPLIDEAMQRKDWVDVFVAIKDAAKQGNTTAANLLVGYRFGKPKPSDQTDPRYLSVIEIIEPKRDTSPDPLPPAKSEAASKPRRNG